jgi:hypothetical protein
VSEQSSCIKLALQGDGRACVKRRRPDRAKIHNPMNVMAARCRQCWLFSFQLPNKPRTLLLPSGHRQQLPILSPALSPRHGIMGDRQAGCSAVVAVLPVLVLVFLFVLVLQNHIICAIRTTSESRAHKIQAAAACCQALQDTPSTHNKCVETISIDGQRIVALPVQRVVLQCKTQSPRGGGASGRAAPAPPCWGTASCRRTAPPSPSRRRSRPGSGACCRVQGWLVCHTVQGQKHVASTALHR